MGAITHITAESRSRGGMQRHVDLNRDMDRAAGHESCVVTLFETMPAGGSDIGLGAAWWWTPGRLRRIFQQRAVPLTQNTMAVYHNAWGMPLLAPGDGAARRMAYLHTDWPGLETAVQASARWCDGIICVSGTLVESVWRVVPEYPRERVYHVKYPVYPPAGYTGDGLPEQARPFRIGYVGRLEVRQKRVERLPALMRAWAAAKAGPVEWHVLGDGPERGRLERAAKGAGDIRFHGWLGGDHYWRMLAALDAVIFFSDYEGTPIALLEAMSVGVTPVFPDIGGDGEELARSLDPDCVYPRGDLDAALHQLRVLAAGNRAGRRRQARKNVAGYTAENYAKELAGAMLAAWERPRYSAITTARAGRWSDWLPMAVVRRCREGAIWG